MSEDKFALLSNAHQWVKQKLVSNEGFSALLVSDHPGGKKMSKYLYDTVEQAIDRCRDELRGELGDATAYAFIFDARTKVGGKLVPMLVAQIEQRGDADVAKLAQCYELKKKWFSSALEFRELEDFRGVGNGEPWLVGEG